MGMEVGHVQPEALGQPVVFPEARGVGGRRRPELVFEDRRDDDHAGPGGPEDLLQVRGGRLGHGEQHSGSPHRLRHHELEVQPLDRGVRPQTQERMEVIAGHGRGRCFDQGLRPGEPVEAVQPAPPGHDDERRVLEGDPPGPERRSDINPDGLEIGPRRDQALALTRDEGDKVVFGIDPGEPPDRFLM